MHGLFLKNVLLEYSWWTMFMIGSVQSLSHVWLFVTPWIAACQVPLSFTISKTLSKLMSIESVMPSNHLILCLPSSSFAFGLSQHQGLFQISQLFASGGQSFGASASASVLPVLKSWFPLGLTGWISLQSTDSQESSPTPQFKSIWSSALSFPYGPALTSIDDHWENHSFGWLYRPLLAK